MNYKELKLKSAPELTKLLHEAKLELQTLRMKVSTKELSKVRQIRQVRKSIANILTALNSPKHDHDQN